MTTVAGAASRAAVAAWWEKWLSRQMETAQAVQQQCGADTPAGQQGVAGVAEFPDAKGLLWIPSNAVVDAAVAAVVAAAAAAVVVDA